MIDIDPTVDFACKMLLGNPAHTALTIHFLNAVLTPEVPIRRVKHLNPISPQKFEADKLALLDILAEDEQGRFFNIEVQRTNPGFLPERLIYYVATQLVEQIKEGDGYGKLCPSIGICLLKAKMFLREVNYHQQFRLRSTTGLELTDRLEIHILELPKFQKRSDNQGVPDPIEQWMDFFLTAQGSDPAELRKRLPDPVFEEAIGVLEMISKTPEERRYYNARLKWERDEISRRNAEEAERQAYIAKAQALIAESKAMVAESEARAAESEARVAESEARVAESEARVAEREARGRAEGMAIGEERGKTEGKAEAKAEQIISLLSLVGEQPVPMESLLKLNLAEMDRMIADLQSRLRNRMRD